MRQPAQNTPLEMRLDHLLAVYQPSSIKMHHFREMWINSTKTMSTNFSTYSWFHSDKVLLTVYQLVETKRGVWLFL